MNWRKCGLANNTLTSFWTGRKSKKAESTTQTRATVKKPVHQGNKHSHQWIEIFNSFSDVELREFLEVRNYLLANQNGLQKQQHNILLSIAKLRLYTEADAAVTKKSKAQILAENKYVPNPKIEDGMYLQKYCSKMQQANFAYVKRNYPAEVAAKFLAGYGLK